MRRHRLLPCLLVIQAGFGFSVQAQQAKPPLLPDVLAAAGRYVADYETAYAAIVSEERYEQGANLRAADGGPQKRVLRSDLLTYHSGEAGWIAFRDVIEVDGKTIPDHADRLIKLVYAPTAHALEDARRASLESARYNIGAMTRTVNVPTVALMLLRPARQSRVRFKLERTETLAGETLAVVSFREGSFPRLILTPDDAPATGHFWIEPTTGRVVRTELTIGSSRYSIKIEVEYGRIDKIGLWVPVRMTEEYAVNDGLRSAVAIVTGKAEYDNFRKFETKAGLVIKK